jgi:hypothetical protein
VDCDSPCADRVVVLSAIISPKVKALLILVTFLHFPNLSFSCMIECGSSHCFIDSHYAKVNHVSVDKVENEVDGLYVTLKNQHKTNTYSPSSLQVRASLKV